MGGEERLLELKLVVTLSVLAQLCAAVLALRLIRVTGSRWAWILISVGVFLMAVRRIIPLYGLYSGLPPSLLDPAFEMVGLVISLCMLAGIAWIGPLFEIIRSHQEELRRSEEKFRRIVDTAQEGIMYLDTAGNASYVNRRMASMLGYAEEEMHGRPASDFQPDGWACVETLGRPGQAVTTAETRNDCRFLRKDGTDLWAIVSVNTVFDDAGDPLGTLAMVTDISDRKRVEREREDLIRELGSVLANVKTLKGLLPICSQCNRVRDGSGEWHPIWMYLKIHPNASIDPVVCPDCRKNRRA